MCVCLCIDYVSLIPRIDPDFHGLNHLRQYTMCLCVNKLGTDYILHVIRPYIPCKFYKRKCLDFCLDPSNEGPMFADVSIILDTIGSCILFILVILMSNVGV